MSRRPITVVASIALAVLLILSVLLATRHDAPGASVINSPLVGKIAPAVSGTSLNGHHLSLSSDKGKIVVINFWASWCGPCQQEAPDLSTFAWQERTHGVVVLGVVWVDDVAAARAFQSTYGSLYPSIIDPGGRIANSYGVTGPPTTFFISPQGRIEAALVGATTTKQLNSVLQRMID